MHYEFLTLNEILQQPKHRNGLFSIRRRFQLPPYLINMCCYSFYILFGLFFFHPTRCGVKTLQTTSTNILLHQYCCLKSIDCVSMLLVGEPILPPSQSTCPLAEIFYSKKTSSLRFKNQKTKATKQDNWLGNQEN